MELAACFGGIVERIEPPRRREFWNHPWKRPRICCSKRLEVWQHAHKLRGRVFQSKKPNQQRLQGWRRQITAVSLLHNSAGDKKEGNFFRPVFRKKRVYYSTVDLGNGCDRGMRCVAARAT